MTPRKEYEFAEVLVHKLYLELLALTPTLEPAMTRGEKSRGIPFEDFRTKLRGFLHNGLSERQKQVMEYFLMGKTEREIASVLGITQQVVNIYKGRARNKLYRMYVS